MEWGIINYGSKSDIFSEPGDSGSIIADIYNRIGGILTGGSGKTKTSDNDQRHTVLVAPQTYPG